MVWHKCTQGKRCMSTQVSFKRRRNTLHLMTNVHPPYLLEALICPLSPHHLQMEFLRREGRASSRRQGGPMEDEPGGEEVVGGVIFCSQCRGSAKPLYLCQNLPFCFNYPISMIQACVQELSLGALPHAVGMASTPAR